MAVEQRFTIFIGIPCILVSLMWVSFRVSFCLSFPFSHPRLALPNTRFTREQRRNKTRKCERKNRGKFVRYQRQQIPSTHTHTHGTQTHTQTHTWHTHWPEHPRHCMHFWQNSRQRKHQQQSGTADPSLSQQQPPPLSPSDTGHCPRVERVPSCNAPIVVANNNEFVI